MIWILIILLIAGAIVKLLDKRTVDPNCKICDGKGHWEWHGFDGMEDITETCECFKKHKWTDF